MSGHLDALLATALSQQHRAEMKNPARFPVVFAVTGPYQVGVYAIVSMTSYAYLGTNVSGFVIAVLPFNGLMRVAAGLPARSICVWLHPLLPAFTFREALFYSHT